MHTLFRFSELHYSDFLHLRGYYCNVIEQAGRLRSQLNILAKYIFAYLLP